MTSNAHCIGCGSRLFKCEVCGETFTANNSIEETEQEYRELFNEEPNEEDVASVCDDCYKELIAWHEMLNSAKENIDNGVYIITEIKE